MLDFQIIKKAVAEQFATLSKLGMYRVTLDKDKLWETYLNSYPEGTNPMFRQRTEHDCNCCKQFIRAVGNAVAYKDGKVISIWDVKVSDPNFQIVVNKLAEFVRSHEVTDEFLHYEGTAGTDKSFEDLANGTRTQWNHFFVNIPREYLKPESDIATALNDTRTTRQVFQRALEEIDMESVDIVLDLIKQDLLYRGTENTFVIESFKGHLVKYQELQTQESKDEYAWKIGNAISGSITSIRNTSIGKLLVALTGGMSLEDAVNAYEFKVAGPNYKRPTAVATKGMIEKAKATLSELGLTSALQRRYAVMNDISINNLLFADRTTRKVLTGDIFDELADATPKSFNLKGKPQNISVSEFLKNVLPTAKSIELLLENRHTSNMVSLIAPEDSTANNMFKWDNKFSWSYVGDVADAIKERVKAAGGNVNAELCCRLAWFNHDDLDIHVTEPDGYDICYSNRGRRSPCGGMQDVDMNAMTATTREPVENIFYDRIDTMREGTYIVRVHQFRKRETDNVGFTMQIEANGEKIEIHHAKAVQDRDFIEVAKLQYSRKDGLKVIPSMASTQTPREIWNLTTQKFHPVTAIMKSPNFWDDQGIGNEHLFFMLNDCVNEDQARGFYNEFLIEELNKHRKVLEMVGNKLKTETSANQLSGVGFSSTVRNSVTLRVEGSFSRVMTVVF